MKINKVKKGVGLQRETDNKKRHVRVTINPKDVPESLGDEFKDTVCRWIEKGKINDNFSFKWYDKIIPPIIKDVSLSWNRGADIYFNFIAEEEQYNFKCILRFGKGTGFSNIRFDIR